MKISCLQENLSKGVGMVSRMVSGKAQLPVLANIMLSTDKGKLKLSATNLETGMNLWVGGKVEEKGRITVPAKVFVELVNSLPQDTVVLATDGDSLKLKCGRFKASVNGISAEEFPEVPSIKNKDDKSLLRMKRKALESSLGQVALAAGVDEARPIFTGVKMELKKSEVRLAATDGYRLSIKRMSGIKGLKESREIVVPARALMELTKVMGSSEEEEVMMQVTEKESQLILAYGDTEIVTRLLEGEFPDFDKIVPGSSSTKMNLNKEELSQAVRAAAIFARDSANIVKFKISSNGLLISANAPQVGENEAEISGKKTGEDAEIAFNSRYLLEMLNAVEGEELRLELSGPLNPGVFKVVGDESFLHIIMPVRVQS